MAEKKNVMDAAAPVEVDKVTGEVKENQTPGIFTVGNVKKQTMEVANDDQDNGYMSEEKELLEGDAVLSGLFVTRKLLPPRDRNSKPIYSYAVYGELRGAEVHAGLKAPREDKGCYGVLNMIFGDVDTLPLYLVPYEMDDGKGGKRSGFTYKVMSLDQEGLLLDCKLVPYNYSDGRILECLIKKVQRAQG